MKIKNVFLAGAMFFFFWACPLVAQIESGDSAYDRFVCYRFEKKTRIEKEMVIRHYAEKIKERFFKLPRLKPSQEAKRIEERKCLKSNPEFWPILIAELEKWVGTLDQASISPTSFISLGQRDELSQVAARLDLLVVILRTAEPPISKN